MICRQKQQFFYPLWMSMASIRRIANHNQCVMIWHGTMAGPANVATAKVATSPQLPYVVAKPVGVMSSWWNRWILS